MQKKIFRAFQSNKKIPNQLWDLLFLLPENELLWIIIDFEGVGKAPNNLNMMEFEKITRETGYIMSWDEIKQFSKSLEQVIDGLFIGVTIKSKQAISQLINIIYSTNYINDIKFLSDKLADCHVIIHMFDSMEWTVYGNDELILEKLMSINQLETAPGSTSQLLSYSYRGYPEPL